MAPNERLYSLKRPPVPASSQEIDFGPIFEAAPAPYLLLQPDLTIAAANAAYLRATGTTAEQIVGRRLFDAFPDNPRDPHANGVRNLTASLERVKLTLRPDRMEIQKYDIRRPAPARGPESDDFEERYWAPLNTPILGPAGELRFILHHVEDVTEAVRLRGRLLAGEKRFHELMEKVPHVIWFCNADGEIEYASGQVEDYMGLSRRESMLGTTYDRALHPEDRELVRA